MNKEQWIAVKNYPDYDVSNMGNVRSCKFGDDEPRQLLLSTNWAGYRIARLTHGRVSKNIRVQRLVAQAFIGDPPGKTVVDHINSIRNDNRVENLRYLTNKENILRGISFSAINARKTHCIKGHPLVQENLCKWERFRRMCLTCHHSKTILDKRRKVHYFNREKNNAGLCGTESSYSKGLYISKASKKVSCQFCLSRLKRCLRLKKGK